MPRKPKVVTPVDEVDIPDEVMAALGAEKSGKDGATLTVGVAERESGEEPQTLEEIQAALVPLAEAIRATLSGIALIPVARATPEQRTKLVRLRMDLDRARADLSTWVDAIDISFRRAALETQATEFTLTDGVVKIEQQRGEWVVNVPALRAELVEFVKHGDLTQHEFDQIFTTTVTEKANNATLNSLAKARGEELSEAIARNRAWKAGDPAAAKVRFQQGRLA